jgi:SAM-dependent methyltransferase
VSLISETRSWWKDRSSRQGFSATAAQFIGILKEFARESTPASRRQRYGDIDFDWEHRVDTTGATVSWPDRFLGHLHSAYQPTDPAAFHEMMLLAGIDFPQYTFIDIGSGKGRVLLMAADYPFRRIIGVELLPALHQVAKRNIAKYIQQPRRCLNLQSTLENATDFVFPEEPLVVYLFNPLGEVDLIRLTKNLNQSLKKNPRPAYALYHNPLLEHVLLNAGWRKLRAERYFSLLSYGS